jgi:hypothetical protein
MNMRNVAELLEHKQQLLDVRSQLSRKASLQTEEGMLYARTLVRLVLVDMELKKVEQKEVRQ